MPWRLAVGLLAAAAYAVLSHWLAVQSAGQPWAVAAVLGPVWAMALVMAVHRRRGSAVAGLIVLAVVVGGVAARGGFGDVNRLGVLQHAGIHALLFVTFAASLRRGRVSLIGAVATRVHGIATPDMLAYCHRVTALWATYFALMALVSVWIYSAFSWATWSVLANLVTPVVIAGLFVGEYLLRYRLHPEFERASLIDAMRAYSGMPHPPRTPR